MFAEGVERMSKATMTPPLESHGAASQQAPPTQAVLMQMISGFMISQALYVVTKLGIPDLLAERPRGVEELARETHTHAPSVYRFMRALAGCGVFAETDEGLFRLTPLSELLRADAPGSQRDFAIFMGEEWHWRVWGEALYSARTGHPAWERVHGSEVFPYFAENPEAAEVFDRAMTSLSRMVAAEVVEGYDFSSVRNLVDVAGGHGSLLAAVLKANAHLTGVLFDVPSVIKGAAEVLDDEGVLARCELVWGDFFESVPVGADAYLMKHIIHDWDDERALLILRNCHRAMASDGRLLLVEMVIAPGNEPHFGKIQDLEMLVAPGGRERTEAEYRKLLAEAGFKLTRIIPTKSPMSIVEAVKAQV
jgi:ubiquinone/menaquinone biosynthesis C-methylase UbiE